MNPLKASMYTSDPDFEAMKDLTRLFWLLDMAPAGAEELRQPAIAGRLPREIGA